MKIILVPLSLLVFSITTAQRLKLHKYFEDNQLHIDLINTRKTPVWMKLKSTDSTPSQIQFKQTAVLAPKEVVKDILTIPKEIAGDTIGFSIDNYINASFTLADPDAKHDDSVLYVLPFKKKKKYNVLQSFNGKFSHKQATSKYAIDFAMPVRSPIVAARKGIVTSTEDTFSEHGGRDFMEKANYIVVLHDDGTIAQYLHLDHKGVLVDVGQKVEKGEHIGYSGHTGFSTEPHLHFVIKDGNGISIPFRFQGYGKKLKSGKKYSRKDKSE